jgi:hypothetical protein
LRISGYELEAFFVDEDGNEIAVIDMPSGSCTAEFPAVLTTSTKGTDFRMDWNLVVDTRIEVTKK